MNRQIPWLRVFAEGVVIVGSILLAFGIQALWDGRVDRREEAESLQALHADFLGTVEELDRVAGSHRLRLAAASELLGISAPGLRALARDSLQTLLRLSTRTTTIDPPIATLKSLIASGELALISDKVLRSRLAGWNGLLDDHEGTQELLLMLAPTGPLSDVDE